jgi:putative ABC transport system permease protein
MSLWDRLLSPRKRMLDELDDDIRDHIAQETQDNIERGMSPEEARFAALRKFGNLTRVKEETREVWSIVWLERLWRDGRFALRMLVKNPGFTAVAVIALALGIGADTAMYTIVSGSLSWHMGLDNPDEIVAVSSTNQAHRDDLGTSYPDFRDFRSQIRSLEGLAAYDMTAVNLSDGSVPPERYWNVEMSANGFSVAEQKPMLGRDFLADDERPGAPAVVILGYHVWRDRYAQDPAIIGKTVRIDEIPHAVIGVMPPGRRFPEETDLWTPLVPDAAREKRDYRNLILFGRLRDGETLAPVRAELDGLASRLAVEYPDTNKHITANAFPIMNITGLYLMKPVILALFLAVGFVLVIACADVANMLLARATERRREIAIRAGLGAGKISILRQLLVESAVLSTLGGFFGWLTAMAGLRAFDRGLGTLERPAWLHPTLDRHALFYLAAIAIGTGILFGLAPALRLAKTDIHSVLKEGAGWAGSKRSLRLSNALVGLQMGCCVVLLSVAGLLLHSAEKLYGTPIGANTANILTMRISLPEARYRDPGSFVAFYQELQSRLVALPGVEAAGAASGLPLGGWIEFELDLEGRASEAERQPQAGGLVVSNSYFQVIQVQPARGRVFLDGDGRAASPVAVVNESFAGKFWPGEEAVGKRVRVIEEDGAGRWLSVVGVVPDILQNGRQSLERDPLIYLPFAEDPKRQMFVFARTRVPPTSLAQSFRVQLQHLDENLAAYDVQTVDEHIAVSRLSVSLFGGMCTVFAAVATLLAAVGLYGVIAHAVSQRTREIGVRIALGAGRRDIMRLVFAQGIRPVVPGLAIGLMAAFAAARLVRGGLVEVAPADPLAFAGTIVVLLGAATLGCVVPARRAMRVDPMVALRHE